MDVARNALVAVVVGVVLLGLAGGLTAYQEPRECSTDVDPAGDNAPADATVLQYSELSPQGQSVFDRARSQDGSVTVTGDNCPADFDYTAGQNRYVVEKGGERFVVETFENDLIPQVGIAIAALLLLALTVTAVGVASHDRTDDILPLIAAGGGAVAGVVTAAGATWVDGLLWPAVGVTLLAAAGVLVVAGLTYRARRAAGVAVAAVLSAPIAAVIGGKTIAAFVIGGISVGAPVLVGVAFAIQYVR